MLQKLIKILHNSFHIFKSLMKTKILLTALSLLFCTLSSFGQTSQAKKYKVKYFKMYKDGELTVSEPNKTDVFILNENLKRIELKSDQESQDRIFKITSREVDPTDNNCTIYYTQMRVNNGQGTAVIIIVVDKFEKLIKLASYQNNENGFKNYMEYQYE